MTGAEAAANTGAMQETTLASWEKTCVVAGRRKSNFVRTPSCFWWIRVQDRSVLRSVQLANGDITEEAHTIVETKRERCPNDRAVRFIRSSLLSMVWLKVACTWDLSDLALAECCAQSAKNCIIYFPKTAGHLGGTNGIFSTFDPQKKPLFKTNG